MTGLSETVGAKTVRVFFCDEDSGECAFYCGELSDKECVMKAIGHMIAAGLDELRCGSTGAISYYLETRSMTDAEVADLPDM